MYVVDASVYVCRIVSSEEHHEVSKRFVDDLCASQHAVLCPEILLPEVSSALARNLDDTALAEQAARVIRNLPGHRFVTVDKQLAESAVEVAARHRLKGMDAIYVALALRQNARLVTLDDEQLHRAPSGIEAVTPQDELEAVTLRGRGPLASSKG